MKIVLTQKEKEQVDRLYLAELEAACLPVHLKAVLEIYRAKDAHQYSEYANGFDVTVEVEPTI